MLEYILSVLYDAVLVYDRDESKFIFISDAVLQITGFKREVFFKHPELFAGLIHPDDKAFVAERAAGLPFPGEAELNYRIFTRNHELKYIQEKRVLLNHTESNHELCIHIMKDITEAVLYKTDAEHKMWFLSTLVNAVGILIFRADVGGRYTFVNDVYTNLLGYHRSGLIGQDVASVVHPEDVNAIRDAIHTCFNNPGGIFHVKHRKLTSTGEVRWVLTDMTAVKNELGEIAEIQGVGMDITDQQSAEEGMLWTKRNLEALINNTADLIWSIDTERKYVFINDSLKDWVRGRYHLELQEGREAMDEYPDTMVAMWRSYYDRALAGETFSENYYDVSPFVENAVTLQISFNPIRNAANEVSGVGCFAHDISEGLKTQEAIVLQNERLLNIASLSSHELRRPVATLMGLIDMLDKHDPGNPENSVIHAHMETVSRELDEVIRLIVNKTFM